MMRLENDLLDLILSVKNKNLNDQIILWKKKPCITVVASAKGYPEKYRTKTHIKNLENIENNFTQQLFHAGTIKVDKKILANGGRVLNATALASGLQEARNKAHQMLDLVDWEDKYFRRDIAWRAIK
jgi:phosphoribosylamine--glycine ligase